MKTLSALRNGWRCPQCGDQTTRDSKGQGFVRHLYNSDCDFERGERDENDFIGKIEFKRADTYRNRMSIANRQWTKELFERNPSWRKYTREKLSNILLENNRNDFDETGTLPQEIEHQRVLMLGYITLNVMIEEVQECEYYLRRFPFQDLPVDRSSHVTNICEMYFSKCYQFKERLKQYLNTLKVQVPGLEVGPVIKQYRRIFERELKVRNAIHHEERFSDLTIEKLFLKEKILADQAVRYDEYRRVTSFWIREIQATVLRLNQIVEAVAKATIENVSFLSKFNVPPNEIHVTIERDVTKTSSGKSTND
ncbi:MAG: hypothetical protein OXQ89_22575 [Rhodospirillaceae bacterium]|nr:hypothetical protein [Rhodospirillaceae bacterium]